MLTNSKISGKPEKDNISGGSLLGERNQRISKSHSSMNDKNGQSRLQFARTNSSPELNDSSVHSFPYSRRTGVVEIENSSKVEFISGRNNMILGVSGNHGRKPLQEKQLPFMNASNASVPVSDPNVILSSNHEDVCFPTNEELPQVSEASDIVHERNLEEHDLINGFNGQVPLPVRTPSHLSIAPPPIVVSSGYPQRNLAGILPPNFSFIGTPWLHNMQFVPPPMGHFVGSPTFAANSEDGNESMRSTATGTNGDDGGNWHDHGTELSGNFNQKIVDLEIFSFKDLSSSLHCQSKSGTEDSNEILRENISDMFFHQVNGGIRFDASNMRLVSSQASSGQIIPGISCDESTDEWGKTPTVVAPSSSLHSKTKTSWQFKSTTECIPSGVDGTQNSNAIPINNREFCDEIAVPGPSAQSSFSQPAKDHDPLQINMLNPVFTPFVISPQHRLVENSVLTFVPTGPPVPFVVYPFMPGNNDSSVPQLERSQERDQFPTDTVFQNFSLRDDADQHFAYTRTPSGNVVTDHDCKSDILNSDFSSHWNNLQYGRFCQNVRPPAPVLYPVAMPPMYLPAHFPLESPGRQLAHSFNLAQVRGPGQGVVPVMAVQPGSERVSGVFQCYEEGTPRYHGGTGTYLPTPKTPFRDRQSGSRNYRGSYNSDKMDHNDKDGRWASSKHRNVGRSYGRSQSEKSSIRLDRPTPDESHAGKHWQPYRTDSYRRESGGPSSLQNHSFKSAKSTLDPVNMAYGVPSRPSTVSSGTSTSSGSSVQPVVMVPYDQSVNYSATTKPIEFGSFGAVPFDSGETQRPTHEVHANGFYEQRHAPHKGGSSHSSPDGPSLPHLRRN